MRHRLAQAPLRRLQEARLRLASLRRSPAIRRPLALVQRCRQQVDETHSAIHHALQTALVNHRTCVTLAAARLEGVSPQAVFARGYSLTRHAASGQLLKTTADVAVGDELQTQLASGTIHSRVTRIKTDQTGE